MAQITVADYLMKRLSDLGITNIFGVPGDYNFHILDAVEANKELKWVGCCNELNAGYAADGYARIKGIGAIITTFGVGELSAVNAIAGSYSESVPVVMIAGSPDSSMQRKRALLHHTLGDGDYGFSLNIFKNITAATSVLAPENAVSEIERVLYTAVSTNKPVYISLAKDVCDKNIIEEPVEFSPKTSDTNALKFAVDHAANALNQAKNPVIIADAGVLRNNLKKQVEQLVEKSGLPVTTMFMGKGAVNETLPNYIGLYDGELINLQTRNAIESSDCVLMIGALWTDYNSGFFTAKLDPANIINVFDDNVTVKKGRYGNVLMKDLILGITEKVNHREGLIPEIDTTLKFPKENPQDPLSSKYIYPRIQEFLKPNDIIIAEYCTLALGFAQVKMPTDCTFYNQALWAAVGWGTPAAFGAGMAERNRRVILLTGEGSHQLTAQEVSSMLRYGLKPIIIVLNNQGYTIERLLSHNPDDEYNEIPSWNYTMIPETFGGNAFTVQARTNAEFDEALRQAEQNQPEQLCYIEAFADKMDAPPLAETIHKYVLEHGMT